MSSASLNVTGTRFDSGCGDAGLTMMGGRFLEIRTLRMEMLILESFS